MNDPKDLTEASLNALVEEFWGGDYAVKPTKFIVPPWVIKEIEEQFGAPVTVEKYHKWNIKRLGLSDSEYWAIISK